MKPMLQIYTAKFNEKMDHDRFHNYLSLLPEPLRMRILKYQHWEDQHTSLYTKLLLKLMLENAGIKSDLSSMSYTRLGRPYLENAPDFNLAHSGQAAVCAMSTTGRIGIDIEEIKQISFEAYKNYFSKEECDHIEQSDCKEYWFYYYWTIKEAVAKADGRGVSLSFDNINLKNNKVQTDKDTWFVREIPVSTTHILHIALDTPIPEKQFELSDVSFH